MVSSSRPRVSISSGQRPSPLSMMQDKLTKAVTPGAVASTDQDTLSTALDSIDNSLKASRPEQGTRPDPSEIKATVESLIADQVKAGTLTSDQADELKDLFTKGPGGGGPGGPRGPGGPVGPPPSGDDASAGSTDSTSDSSTDAVLSFLQELLASRNSSTCGTTGLSLSPPTTRDVRIVAGSSVAASADLCHPPGSARV